MTTGFRTNAPSLHTFQPPTSGEIFAAFVEAFALREHDDGKTLSQKTAQRYLAGGRVGDDAVARIIEAIVAAAHEAQVVPAGLGVLDLRSPALEELRARIPVTKTVGALVAEAARQWDLFAGAVRTRPEERRCALPPWSAALADRRHRRCTA